MSKAACFAPDVLGLAVHQTEKRVVDQESIQLCQTLHVGHIYIQEVEFSMPTYAHMVWVYFPQSHGVFRPMDLFDFLPVKSGLGSWGELDFFNTQSSFGRAPDKNRSWAISSFSAPRKTCCFPFCNSLCMQFLSLLQRPSVSPDVPSAAHHPHPHLICPHPMHQSPALPPSSFRFGCDF